MTKNNIVNIGSRKEKTRLLETDATEATIIFGNGYDEFQYPLTVSFWEKGKYEVLIEGKVAKVIKVE